MTLWTLLENDHADIAVVGQAIVRASGHEAARIRERLLSEMADDIEAHFEAEEDGLFHALGDKQQVRALVADLKAEHEEIEEQLDRLTRIAKKNSAEWTSRFEDFSALLQRHFHREERELFMQAKALLTGQELHEAMRDYIRGKTEEIWNRHRRFGLRPRAIWAGIAVVAAGLVLAAERKGYVRLWFPNGAQRAGIRGGRSVEPRREHSRREVPPDGGP
jgi:hemerythrin-like domain-containing protein